MTTEFVQTPSAQIAGRFPISKICFHIPDGADNSPVRSAHPFSAQRGSCPSASHWQSTVYSPLYELTAAYTQVGEDGYPVYVYPATVFKVKKNGEKSNINWTDKAGSEFTGTVSYQDGNFTLSYETNSPDSKIKQCTGATLYLKDSDYTDTSSKTSQTTTAAAQKNTNIDLSPYGIWEYFLTNNWVDEEGNNLNFEQNITYYKLTPNSGHSTYDVYMRTLTTSSSKGRYYGHYHVDDDKTLQIEFNSWPDMDIGFILDDKYVWDSTLQKKTAGAFHPTQI